jgi:V8-like Glu-specific endopeptidase
MFHSASTKGGASGSPIFFREDDSVIGLHNAGSPYYNTGYFIDDILSNIQMIYSSIDEFRQHRKTIDVGMVL